MQLELRGLGEAPDYLLRGVGYSFRAVLRHTGSRRVRVSHRRVSDGADYDIVWVSDSANPDAL